MMEKSLENCGNLWDKNSMKRKKIRKGLARLKPFLLLLQTVKWQKISTCKCDFFKHLFWKNFAIWSPFGNFFLLAFVKGKNSKSYGMKLDFYAISSFAIIGKITSVSLPILVLRFPFLWTLHVFLETSKQAQCIYISSFVFANF